MQLRLTAVITSLLVALPAAALLTVAIESWRARDLSLALGRVVLAQLNVQLRERCESDPKWFFTGPLVNRPKPGDPPPTDEALAPRARASDQPYELFAFDEEFTGSSPASPRFPAEFRQQLRRAGGHVVGPFPTPEGTGTQIGVWTGWAPGPCAALLGRLRPPPGQTLSRVRLFAGLTAVCFAVALVALAPTVRRIRRLARDAQASTKQEFGSIAPDSKKRDEIAAITFAYNDAAKELHVRRTAIADRDEAMRRFVAGVAERLTDPSRLQNLIATARLRGKAESLTQAPLDLAAVARDVASRSQHAATAAGVTLTVGAPAAPVRVTGDAPLLAQALSNLVDNAIRAGRSGSTVAITIEPAPGGFSLRVTDTGRGVSDEELKGLSAIRRFRGDEDRTQQPGTPGLGLAVAREVAERHGFTMDLRRPAGGGFEVAWTGATI